MSNDLLSWTANGKTAERQQESESSLRQDHVFTDWTTTNLCLLHRNWIDIKKSDCSTLVSEVRAVTTQWFKLRINFLLTLQATWRPWTSWSWSRWQGIVTLPDEIEHRCRIDLVRVESEEMMKYIQRSLRIDQKTKRVNHQTPLNYHFW